MRVLVTGGAGFVGANLAVGLAARHPDWHLVALDNLRRRGSELNLPRLAAVGVEFVHGDVRQLSDLAAVGTVDAIVECSAEPSVVAGNDDGLDYLIQTNLFGAIACLERCRRDDAHLIFLSTSRVYPVELLRSLQLEETESRFTLADRQEIRGASAHGISEEFPLDHARTLYGTTKLAAELLVMEYIATFGVRAVVDRFGVIAGPWQMGKLDQGVFSYWLLAHRFNRPLAYLGFGGSGKQVRDVLHVEDAIELINLQLCDPDHWQGAVVNVGGGRERAVSLRELTALCQDVTSAETSVEASDSDRPGDVPLFITDSRRLFARTDWRPQHDVRAVLEDIDTWIVANADSLESVLR